MPAPDLDQARRRAKELLRAARAGDPQARERLRDDRAPRLADAQRAVAADLGFPSWPALVAEAEASAGDRGERRARLVRAALEGRGDLVERLLARDAALAAGDLAAALVLGDADAVAAALARDPELVAREVPGTGRRPLSCACHSALLGPDAPRAAGVRRVIALLLDHGADPNEAFDNAYGAMPALYGAAGVAHDPEATRLLLDRGADPNDGESLYHAVEAGDTTCLELLLDRGAGVRGTNALGHAIALGDARKVRLLLERGDLRPTDPELRDALLHARAPAVVDELIAHGAALDARGADGRTPASAAARLRSPEVLRRLQAAGAPLEVDPAAEWVGAVVRGDLEHAARVARTHPGLVLSDADAEELPRWASAGDDEVVGRLLDAGVPLDARGVDEGTALHYAALWGRASTVALLLARGAEADVMGGPREHPGTPLGWAAWGSRALPEAQDRLEGYLGATAALLAAGARVGAGMLDVAADDVAALLEDAAQRSGVTHETGRRFAPGQPVRVRVRRRGDRVEVDDLGAAVAFAGRPPGWRAVAERAAAGLGWNVSRHGVVFVRSSRPRDVDDLVRRTADAALAVADALLALQG